METNLIFAGIMAVTGILMLIQQRKTNRIEATETKAKADRLEAWHQDNPGNRWLKVETVSPQRTSGDGQDWFRTHSPATDSGTCG